MSDNNDIFKGLFSDMPDVCIIGSGFAGTVLGQSLAQQGVKTVILESGKGMKDWVLGKKLKGLASYEFSGNTNYPLTQTKARLIGGNSSFWTGRVERLHPTDFETHPYTPKDNPWPISYTELDPYYELAEQTLRVKGSIKGVNVPPRNKTFPLPRAKKVNFLSDLFAEIDVDLYPTPSATPTKSFRFFNIHKEVLPEFLNSPNGELISGVTVTKLIPKEDQSIDYIELRTWEGIPKIARAKHFVLACGGIESARLLLLSQSESFPNGIGNSSDRVGRGFNEHPAVNFYSKITHSLGTLAPTNKIARTHQVYEKYRPEGLGSIIPVIRQAWILPHHVMPFRPSNIPKMMWSFVDRIIHPVLYMGATIEQSISDTNRVTLSRSKKDIYGNPIAHLHFDFSKEDLKLLDKCRELTKEWLSKVGATKIIESEITFSRHHQGTCRMGDNPKTSVVDKNLKVHECENLYIAGSETFVTGGGMQPVCTIVALSHRLADHLVEHLKK